MKTGAPALRMIAFVAVVYLAAGFLFGALAAQAASHEVRVAWRGAAWGLSAVAFGAHITYEHVLMRSSPRTTALRVASAAGLAAFGLAVAANLHAMTASSRGPSLILAASLAVWPVMVALPAFAVALVAAALLARARPGA
jgi:hypothetical protein